MHAIRPERPSDVEAIGGVHRLAFGREAEAQLIDALRDAGEMRVSLVAEAEGVVVGHILFSFLSIVTAGDTIPALALAPLAVLPEFQSRGIGSQLVRDGLSVCRDQRHRIVLVLGDPRYYRRFGFSAELARRLVSPFGGDAFMALELADGALAGIEGNAIYPASFLRDWPKHSCY
jgi:putative acetyltransferase